MIEAGVAACYFESNPLCTELNIRVKGHQQGAIVNKLHVSDACMLQVEHPMLPCHCT